jgi:carbohydrate-selective porin OprB
MPNKYNWITLGLGQIPISKFDSPIASDLQRYYFLNSALAQNTTFTYPTAGIGAYTTLLLSKNLNLSLGSIDATNPLANGIHFKNFDKYSSFISVNYTPKLKNKYQGSYSLILYDKPSVEKTPFNSQGWSLYLAQDITNKHSLFLRLNGASSNYPIIKNSYSFGVLVTNPFNRLKNDKFGIAYSINKPNNTTSKEHIIETYYDYKLNSNISIRPDIQFYHHQKNNLVFSLSMQLEL